MLLVRKWTRCFLCISAYPRFHQQELWRPTFGTFAWQTGLIKVGQTRNKRMEGRTDGRTNGRTDEPTNLRTDLGRTRPLIEMR